ncbi:MAG: MotA/TolQ/ExbB proton channel family protein [Phycisphaerales bacterium]|nr:MotA/TolQ/ExbB proton channel family protein [Phycisphaerales bacterium]
MLMTNVLIGGVMNQGLTFLAMMQDGEAGGGAAAAPAKKSMSILDYIASGGALSYVLVLLSVLAVAMIIWNLIELRPTRLAPPELMEQLKKLLAARQVEAAIEICKRRENDSFIARVMSNGLSRTLKSPFGFLEVRAKLEEAAAREVEVLDRPTNVIGMLAAVGPMLGLLGTVIGLIGAFGVLSGLEGAARSNELSRFMSYALVCTAEGLVLAIPCTFLYAIFRRRTTRLVAIIGAEAESLVAGLQVAGAPAIASKPAGAAAMTPAMPGAVAPAAAAARPVGVVPTPTAVGNGGAAGGAARTG